MYELLNIVRRFTRTRLVRRVARDMRRLYPNEQERAGTLLATAAKEVETGFFGQGEVLTKIIVTPLEDGSYGVLYEIKDK